ncbi:hypothetical protein ABFA25_03060 [Mycobacterium lepromatosis]
MATANVFLMNWLPGALELIRLSVEDIRVFTGFVGVFQEE